jgi:hypothetical protein
VRTAGPARENRCLGAADRVNVAAADIHPLRESRQVATIHDVILPDLADQMPYKRPQ